MVIPDAVSSPEAHGMVYGAPARQGLRQRILAAATAPVTPAEPMQWGTGDVKRSTFSESAYEDFDTIDWIRDQMNDRVHRASVDAKANQKGASIFLKVARAFYRVQAWILLTIVAVFTGIIAAVIDVSVDFLEDTRVGFCQDGMARRGGGSINHADDGQIGLRAGTCAARAPSKASSVPVGQRGVSSLVYKALVPITW